MNILVVHEADYIDQVVYEYQIIPELLASKDCAIFCELALTISMSLPHLFLSFTCCNQSDIFAQSIYDE